MIGRRTLIAGLFASALLVPARAAVVTSSQTTAYGSGTNTAGSTANLTTIDARTAMKVTFAGSITNGATAPTIAATATLQWSPDNFTTTWVAEIGTASLTNSAATNFKFEIYVPSGYVRISIGANTAQSVTYSFSSATASSIQ